MKVAIFFFRLTLHHPDDCSLFYLNLLTYGKSTLIGLLIVFCVWCHDVRVWLDISFRISFFATFLEHHKRQEGSSDRPVNKSSLESKTCLDIYSSFKDQQRFVSCQLIFLILLSPHAKIVHLKVKGETI